MAKLSSVLRFPRPACVRERADLDAREALESLATLGYHPAMLLDLIPYNDPLSRTPTVLRAAVLGRPDEWLDSRHAPDVFSPRQTVAHLLICEAEWIVRIRRVLEPERDFPPGPYDDVRSADLATSRSTAPLLDGFEAARFENLCELQTLGLTPEDLDKSRDYDEPWTDEVGQLLATWVAHDLYHLGQIFKSFSALYIDRIGPYQAHLNLPHLN